MKIVKLVAENVKRLHAVEITPDGTLITIGGKNGAGKSSVLDSIAYAMGGEKLVPAEPIRAGEAEAKIVVDLGDLIVTRRFKREPLAHGPDTESGPGPVTAWGETRSTLIVTNKDGAKYPSPQSLLDKLYGHLTFDPLAFARDEPKRQDETLRKLVGLDVTPIKDRRAAAFAQRTMLRKTHSIKEAQLLALPRYDGVPEAETPLADIMQELKAAEELRKLADEAGRTVEYADRERLRLEDLCQVGYARIEDLRRQLEATQAELDKNVAKFEESRTALKNATVAEFEATQAVPDTQAIRAKIQQTEAVNAQVRANARRAEFAAETEALLRQAEEQTRQIEAADAEMAAALAAAPFPVAGLGLSDEGVTLNGLPFAQAGSAEQVRVSVAIGIALNPKLQVLLIRNGNLLDDDSIAVLEAQAEAAGMQVWMEYVTGDSGDVSVMMEDGHAAR